MTAWPGAWQALAGPQSRRAGSERRPEGRPCRVGAEAGGQAGLLFRSGGAVLTFGAQLV